MEASKPVSAKQLKEHLQHQQEPFSLHNYLSERRFFLKNFSSDIDHFRSEKSLKLWIKYEKHKMRKRFLHASGILRSLLSKFIPIADHNQHLPNWVGVAASDHYTNNDVEGKGLPCHNHSPKLVSMFHTFSLPKLGRLEVDAGTKPHWISTIEKRQQHYKESEWEQQIPNAVCRFKSHEAPVTTISTLSQKSKGDPMFSTYLRKLLMNPNILKLRRPKKDKLQEIVGTAPLRRRNRSTQQKRKQLLFGCVEKAREFQENKEKSERFCLLEKRCGEAEKITHLLHAESCVISEEWRNFHKLSRDIHVEIGDAIVDDIVKEMLYILLN